MTAGSPTRLGLSPTGQAGATVLVALLLAAPALDGCVHPMWRAALTSAACLFACVGLCVALLRGATLRLPPGTIPLALFTAFVWLQTAPVGLGALSTAPLELGETSAAAKVPAITMSRARESLALLATFVGAALLLSDSSWLRRAIWALLLLTSALAAHYATSPFLEIVPTHVPATGHVAGTYLNRNHLAALFVLGLIAGAGLFVNRRQTRNHGHPSYLRGQVLLVVLLITTCLGLLLTASRGGFASLIVGGLVLTFLLARRRETEHRWGRLLGVAALLVVAAISLPQELVGRYAELGRNLTSAGSRPDLWMMALRVFEASPLVGCGLGNFGELSVLVQPDTVRGHLEHAHCDLLQFLAETGVVGLNLLLSAGLLIGLHILHRTRETRGDRRTILACAATAAVAAFSAHALVDFNFQIPALALWVAALAGIASGTMARANNLPALGWRPPSWTYVPLISGFGVAAGFAANEAWSWQQVREARRSSSPAQELNHLLAADQTHPGHGRIALAAAEHLYRSTDRARRLPEIRSLTERAIAQNPVSARAHWLRGMADLGSDAKSVRRDFETAIRLSPPAQRQALRISAGLALATGRRRPDRGANSAVRSELDVARRWFQSMFESEDCRPKQLLVDMHAAAAVDMDLIPLLPAENRELLRDYAALLLADGRLALRERVLDTALMRSPMPQRRTIRENVHLVAARVAATNDATLRVTLHFELAQGHQLDGQLMCVSSTSPNGRFDHYFHPRPGRTDLEFAIPTHAPPGPYAVALQPYSGAMRFPIGALHVVGRPLHLQLGQAHDAERALYRSQLQPTPRPRGAQGLAVGPGTTLHRDVRIATQPAALLITTAGTHPIVVRWRGRELRPFGQRTTTRRYELTGAEVGRLEIVSDTKEERILTLRVETPGGLR